MLGETSPEAQPIQEALKKAREQSSSLLERGRFPEVHPKIAGQDREDPSRLTRAVSLLQQALESLGGCATKEPPVWPEPMYRPQVQMDVKDFTEEVRRLRAQVAELQHERAASDVMLTLIDAAESTLR